MTCSEADDEFQTLLCEALADPERADHPRLREAYTRSSLYIPYGRDQEGIEELHMRIATRDWEPAAELVQELLDEDPLSITLRFAFSHVLEGLREEWEASSQRSFADGLLRCILRSGDGRSAASALHVVDPRELDLVLDVLGLSAVRSQLHEHDGRWFDAVEADGRGGPRTVYFDVDAPQRWLQKMKA